MKTYTASRFFSGNGLFPAKIVIDDLTVTLKNPRLFSGQEKSIPYSRIASVNIEVPFIGFSSIAIETTGEGKISATGFLESEVKEMKEFILSKIRG